MGIALVVVKSRQLCSGDRDSVTDDPLPKQQVKSFMYMYTLYTLSHVVWLEDVATSSVGTETTIVEVHELSFCLIVQSNCWDEDERASEKEWRRGEREKEITTMY